MPKLAMAAAKVTSSPVRGGSASSPAVAAAINDLLQPVRDHFANDPYARKLLTQIKKWQEEMRAAKKCPRHDIIDHRVGGSTECKQAFAAAWCRGRASQICFLPVLSS